MAEIEIPQYFICPISLQIMKDPVTAVTGITYDRESIEQWLITSSSFAAVICPVTKQPLTPDLTPNHMLRRLIQAWCIANGADCIPTPKSPVHKSLVRKLIRDINAANPLLQVNSLRKMAELAGEDERSGANRKVMAEADASRAMVFYVVRCFREGRYSGLGDALAVLHLTWTDMSENRHLVENNLDLIQSLLWTLQSDVGEITGVRTNALLVLKTVAENATSALKEQLDGSFFRRIVEELLHGNDVVARRAVLHILIKTSTSGRNRVVVVEAGAVSNLIEAELRNPEKRTSELIFGLMAQLCSCADGRQQILKHAAGISVVAKRLLRVSPATDEAALCIIESIARFSATREVVMEMLMVGAVSKLCMMLQANCSDNVKKKAREVLRLHSGAWTNSPCIQVYLLTRNPR